MMGKQKETNFYLLISTEKINFAFDKSSAHRGWRGAAHLGRLR
jgi:hypothetical protein